MAKENIGSGRYRDAINQLESAQVYPYNLGEGKLPGAQENDIFYWLGCAYEGLNDCEKSKQYFEKATTGSDEPAAAIFYNDQQPDKLFYQGLSLQKLGKAEEAGELFSKLINYGNAHLNDQVQIDYFAVSLPNLLIFDDDLNFRNLIHCYFIKGLGLLGSNEFEKAEEMFLKALSPDALHFGAKTHLAFCKSIMQIDNK